MLVLVAVLVFGGCAEPAPGTLTPTAPTPVTPTPIPTPATPTLTPATPTPTPAAPASISPAQTTAPAKVYELALNEPIPSLHLRWINVVNPWVEEVERCFEGRLKITPYFAGSLASNETGMEALQSGMCDIAEGGSSGLAGLFPLTEVVTLVTWSSSALTNSRALWKAYQQVPAMQAEWGNVKDALDL